VAGADEDYVRGLLHDRRILLADVPVTRR